MNRGRSLSSGGAAGRSSFDLAWPPSPSQRTRSKSLFDQLGTGDGNETSDWSSTGSLVSGREKLSPKDRGDGDGDGGGGEGAGTGDDMLHQVISERITEVTEDRERRSSLDELVASAERKLGKEAESQRFSEKETDTLSDFSSSSLLSRDRQEIPKTKSVKDRPSRPLRSEASVPVQIVDRSSARNGKENSASASVSSDSEFRAQPHSHQQNGSLPGKDKRTERTVSNGSARSSPLLTPETAGLYSSTPVPRLETPAQAREENVTIRIKRPRDYIHQWEDTIDRLSNVSVTDKIGSPRTPLISSYSTFKPNGTATRSRSYETSTSTAHTEHVTGSSSSYSRRNVDLQRRSKSNTLPARAPQITVSPSSSNGSNREANGNGLSTSASAHIPPSGPNTDPYPEPALASILDRLPPEMRQQARDASKFLMQSTGPEVMALMDAIKRTRTTGPTQETPPTQTRYQPHPTDASEQTILKRRDLTPLAPQFSGARVRFQPQSRSVPSHPSTQSEGSLSSSPLPPTSPRVQSSSPRRRAAQAANGGHSNGDGGERGSHRMLSISPRGQVRSRSLSPSAVREASASTTNGAGAGGVARASSPRSLSLREDLLLRNLGTHSRVVEEERPSARLIALTSSPRVEAPVDSPGRSHAISPRRPAERLYPEVTRLDLGLDSDRSFVSHDGGNEDGAMTPPPLRRAGGGAGRMPRREAWEQQRRRKGETRTSATSTAKEDMTTPEGQSRFIEVLCKEIDALKAKVDSIEEDSGRRSIGRASRSPSAGPAVNTRLSYSSLDVRDEDNRMMFQPQRYPSVSHTQSVSPRRDRATSCPLLETSSRSYLLAGTRSSPRGMSGGQQRHYRTPSSLERHTAGLGQLSVDTSGLVSGGPHGYSSPVRSITPEVWGHDLSSPRQGFEPARQSGWKRLISTRNLSEQQTIELKQALACALAENDILTAKLNNARHEIHDKLHHTNGVLDDCRRHLAKSQAENQELRTMLEQERSKSQGFESRIKEMENSMNEVWCLRFCILFRCQMKNNTSY